ncbi:hypothetical protein VUR80DRAFT_2767 [Thermomyces stellatus]
MAGVAGPELAAEVSTAGGIGFLGCAIDVSPGSAELSGLEQKLREVRRLLGPDAVSGNNVLPVGVGFLTCHASIRHFSETALPVVARCRPAAVWLFAPDEELKPHRDIVSALRKLDPRPVIFVQIGNVVAAREAAEDGADVVVCQGIDAGGHQFRRGSGVAALVPEVCRMLAQEFAEKSIAVFAAGGIAEGRGVAAMLALGADGIVMGTRFATSSESMYAAERKRLILSTQDGGRSTLKSPFNDAVTKSTLWGPSYDGRAIVGPIQEAYLSGTSLEDCQERVEADVKAGVSPPQVCTWASAAVGLITREQAAAEIVREVGAEALDTISRLASSLT